MPAYPESNEKVGVNLMNDKKQQAMPQGLLTKEIRDFIEFKRQSGSLYLSSASALKAFDRFCAAMENQDMTPQQLASEWMKPGDGKPRYDGGCCVRQLGQYLTEQGHPKAFTVLSTKGNAPRLLGIKAGLFAREIEEFVGQKRAAGRLYISEECHLKSFDKFCAMKGNELLAPQQLADAWCGKANGKNTFTIGMIRELGMFLTMQGSTKSFVVPYANGDMPKPAFDGYKCLFAEEIVSFLEAKRAAGLKYRQEEFRLKDFDKFCNRRSDLKSSPQQLAEAFLQSQEECGSSKGKRSKSVMKAFGSHLTDAGCPIAFTIIDKNFVAGPYAEEISVFVAFKKSCGYKYITSGYFLRSFDVFCALEENKALTPQQLADRWVLKRGGEHPNTRAGRVDTVRVFGKYLTSIGHPRAYMIAAGMVKRVPPRPPYLFSEDDIDRFFGACVELKRDEMAPSMHIVLPAAFLFMYCMGVRTCELKIRMENVDLKTGEVIIMDSKTGGRVVFLNAALCEFLFKYNLVIEKIFPHHRYLFPASENRSRDDFAKHFRELWEYNVSTPGHGIPRLYDFRHHLLYRNVELCMRGGGDVNVLRPYLMRHMGHKLPESFQYYFHLSPPIRKEVSRIKKNLDWMIPDVMEVPYE